MTHRPKTDNDQAALDRARAHLAAIGAGPRPALTDGATAHLTPDERAERLRRRAAARKARR